MEPLQDEHQGIKDPALARLVECLAAENAGLCVITTREPVKEFDDFPETTEEVDLEHLSEEAGRALLRIKDLHASDDLLERASDAFGSHALALNLLASYLKRFAGGDVSKAFEINDLPDVEVDDGKHPRRVMAAFAEKFGEGPELDLLHVMGLFDRPADGGCISALRKPPAISGLTDHLATDGAKEKLTKWWRQSGGWGLTPTPSVIWRMLLYRLRKLGLLAEASHHAPNELDAHPLVREHFGTRLRDQHPDAWAAGHERLYEHLKGVPEEHRPETLVAMAPLFQAVHHGCQAGRRQEVLDEIYKDRITREHDAYLMMKLGAFGADLGLVSSFFDPPFERTATDLKEPDRAWLSHEAAFSLRALGRFGEAVDLMELSLSSSVILEDWRLAATSAANLSLLQYTIGKLSAAVVTAKNAIAYSERAEAPFWRACGSVALGYVKHQRGLFEESFDLFKDALSENVDFIQSDLVGHSYHRYLYCDLLLSMGRLNDLQEEARRMSGLMGEHDHVPLIATSFASLSQGHAFVATGNYDDAKLSLNEAVEHLRNANIIDFLPYGLLARAAFLRETEAYERSRLDLAEVMRIATRCGFLLHECDAHLGFARLALAEDNADAALPHFQSADALVTECGYHRRDPEIAALREQLKL